jgi:hypothetical protein
MGGIANSVGGFLGMGGDPSYNTSTGNPFLGIMAQNAQDTQAAQQGTPYQQVASGQLDPNSALAANGSYGMQNALAQGPVTGSQLATSQVQSNPILGQLFGNQGLMSKEIGTEQNLQNQGYQLQPQDLEAYGQASGNIARMFGQGENDLSQSLSNRGLASAPSGAAGAQFTGLQGSKNEQLAQAQTAIANQRMQNTMQRIGQQQQFINQLGGQAGNAIQNQFGRQLAGSEAGNQQLAAGAGAQNQANSIMNTANGQQAQFQQNNKPLNLGDFYTSGFGQGAQFAGGGFVKSLGGQGGSGGGASGGGGSAAGAAVA